MGQREVLETREVQIREKNALKKLEKELDVKYMESLKGKWADEAKAEKMKQDARRNDRMKAQEQLLLQIRANEEARARERQKEYFQVRLMKEQEQLFEEQLRKMRSEKYEPRDFRKKK